MVLLVELVFLLEGYVAHSLVFLDEFLHLLLQVLTLLLGYGLELLDDVTLLGEVLVFLATLTGTGGVAGLEELVAGTEELFP